MTRALSFASSSPKLPYPFFQLAAKNVLFVGVLSLYRFDYGQIREFSSYSLQVLAQQMPNAEHVAMTMHGIGYGLDEKEAFLAQLAGLFDATHAGIAPSSLTRITIVEKNQGRASRLKQILEKNLPSETISEKQNQEPQFSPPSKIARGGLQ